MKHKDIISQMTLEEKCYLMSGKDFWQSRSVERLGVPNMTLSDGSHGIRKQEGLIEQIVRIQFERIKMAPPQELIEAQQSREVDIAKAKLNLLNSQYQQKQKDYQDLRAETFRVIQGTSHLNVDFLNSIVEETIAQIKDLEKQRRAAEAELQELVTGTEKVRQDYTQLMNWAELFGKCNLETMKVIIAQFVKAVRVKRDYEIDVEFKVSPPQQLMSVWRTCSGRVRHSAKSHFFKASLWV